MPINRNKRTRYMKLVEMAHNEDIEEILKRLYLDEQNNIREVAEKLGVGPATVLKWIRLFDIQTRQMTFV